MSRRDQIRRKTYLQRKYRGWNEVEAEKTPVVKKPNRTKLALENGVCKHLMRKRIARGWCWYRAATTPAQPYFYEWNPKRKESAQC